MGTVCIGNSRSGTHGVPVSPHCIATSAAFKLQPIRTGGVPAKLKWKGHLTGARDFCVNGSQGRDTWNILQANAAMKISLCSWHCGWQIRVTPIWGRMIFWFKSWMWSRAFWGVIFGSAIDLLWSKLNLFVFLFLLFCKMEIMLLSLGKHEMQWWALYQSLGINEAKPAGTENQLVTVSSAEYGFLFRTAFLDLSTLLCC